MRVLDDLAGAVYDLAKFILESISYFFAGMIIVALPIYLLVWVIGMFQ